MDRLRVAVATLRLDAVANLVLAAALVAGAAPVAGALGLAEAWPLVLVAVLIAFNGVLCWAASRQPRPTGLRRLAGVDVVFSIAVLALAALNPGDAGAAVRWVLVVLGDVVAVVAAVKLWCAGGVRLDAVA